MTLLKQYHCQEGYTMHSVYYWLRGSARWGAHHTSGGVQSEYMSWLRALRLWDAPWRMHRTASTLTQQPYVIDTQSSVRSTLRIIIDCSHSLRWFESKRRTTRLLFERFCTSASTLWDLLWVVVLAKDPIGKVVHIFEPSTPLHQLKKVGEKLVSLQHWDEYYSLLPALTALIHRTCRWWAVIVMSNQTAVDSALKTTMRMVGHHSYCVRYSCIDEHERWALRWLMRSSAARWVYIGANWAQTYAENVEAMLTAYSQELMSLARTHIVLEAWESNSPIDLLDTQIRQWFINTRSQW